MVREALKNEVNVMIKSSPADLVTVTDQKVEKMLLSFIKEKYPSHRCVTAASSDGVDPAWSQYPRQQCRPRQKLTVVP